MNADEPIDDSALRGLAPEVVAQLVASHARFLAFLQRRVRSTELAEEILQDAFVRALARGETLRDGESAVAWFYRLLRNALIDHYRRAASKQRALDAAAAEPIAPEPALDEELNGVVCACIHDLLDTLAPQYADAIRRVDLEQQSVADYAAQGQISHNNAGVRLHRARQALMRSLVRSCGTCATHGCLDCHCQRDPATGVQKGSCS